MSDAAGAGQQVGRKDEREITRRLRLAFGALIALLVVVLASALLASRDLHDSARSTYVEDAVPLRGAVKDLLLQMVNEETGVRGFLVTARESSLDPFHDGRSVARNDLREIAAHAGRHAALRALLPQARREVAALEAYFGRQIALVRSGPAGQRRAQRDIELGQALFDRFRRTAERMDEETARFVEAATTTQRHRFQLLVFVLCTIGGAVLVIAGLLAVRTPRRVGALLAALGRERRATLAAAAHERRLHAVTTAIAASGDRDELVRAVAEQAIQGLDALAGYIGLVREDGGELDMLAFGPAGPERVTHWQGILREPRSPLTDAIAGRRPLYLESREELVREYPQIQAVNLDETPGARAFVPLRGSAAVLGVLGVLFAAARSFDEADRSYLETLAAQAAQALERLRAEERRHRAQADLEEVNAALRRLLDAVPQVKPASDLATAAATICDAALAAFEADAAALWSHAAGSMRLVHRAPPSARLPAGSTLAFDQHPEFRKAVAAGRPTFVPDVEQASPALWDAYARGTGSRAQLRLPLAAAGSEGLLVISWAGVRAPLGEAALVMAGRFADQAAVALAETEAREAQATTARLHARLEQNLLPTIRLDQAPVSVLPVYQPGESRMQLGGDFYDGLELRDGRVAVLIGDVSGHGPDAAALAAGLRAAWRALVLTEPDPPTVLAALNEVVAHERGSPEHFATVAYALVDAAAADAEVALAGHPPPLLTTGAGVCALEIEAGPPLGVLRDSRWPGAAVDFPRGGRLVLYTDGLVEGRAAPGTSERFGIERVLRLLTQRGGAQLDDAWLHDLVAEVARANGGPLPDDVAVLVVEHQEQAVGGPDGAASDGERLAAWPE